MRTPSIGPDDPDRDTCLVLDDFGGRPDCAWHETDAEALIARARDSKEGESIRPIGLPVVEYLKRRRTDNVGTYVFPGLGEHNAFGSFPTHLKHLFEDSRLSDITPHVLRHSFASIANDLGFTEVTIAALVGHAKGSVCVVHFLVGTVR